MKDAQTWRELLGMVISDPAERQRLTGALGVNPITLIRWATKKSSPRQDKLRSLFEALPQYQPQLRSLIVEEYPNSLLESTTMKEGPQIEVIPSEFYADILQTHISAPRALRTSSICTPVLQQIVEHLDPHEQGIVAMIAQCVPSSVGQKVRSLRIIMGRGTHSWETYLENYTQFLGCESPAGRSIASGHLEVAQSSDDQLGFPSGLQLLSAVACPILLSDCVAGSLYIGSTQENFFSTTVTDLIQRYADLLIVGFERDEFYSLHDIAIEVMPPAHIQQSYIASFQQRITHHMLQAYQGNQSITRLQAELVVWQAIEEELLYLSLDSTPS